MACRTLGGSWLIGKDFLAGDRPELGMTATAGGILVRPLERKDGLLVVEPRRPPAGGVMTFCAAGRAIGVGELRPMWIGMTLFARCRRCLEIDMHQRALHADGPVTPRALHCPVRPFKSELRLRVVEEVQVAPLLRGMARLAPIHLASGNLLHARPKLTLVWVRVTRLASQFREVVGHGFRFASGLMTFAASYSHMPAGQHECALLVPLQSEGRSAEALFGVALFATVLIRRSRKLPLVYVLVAARTARKFHLEERGLARGDMALGAVHRGMFLAQRETGSRMVCSQKL